MRMEPVEKKSSLKMGIAFSEALEHRDPSRTAEGYWRDTPLHDRIMDRTAETEIAQVELLSALYLERYADDVAPGRIWTPEFEFKSDLLGRGFLDAIIEESNGREGSCPVHGQGVSMPGHGMLAMDGGSEQSGVPGLLDRGASEGEAGAPGFVRAPHGSADTGHAHSPSVLHAAVREPGAPATGDASGERAGLDEGCVSARPRVDGREHVPGARAPGVPDLQQGEGASSPSCSCRRTIGVENKLLGSFFWNDSSRKVLAFDDQVTAYFAACREYGTPLDKMLYRVTKKPSIKPDSRKGESIPDYIKRLTERIEADPSYAFEQHELYRTDAQLDEFLEECAEVNEHVKLSRRREAWPKSTKACTMFGGCSFLPVCRNEVGLEDQFRIRPLPAPKPKLPRLGKVQKAVLLALGDAFTSTVTLAALHKEVPHATDSVTAAVKALVSRGLIDTETWMDGDTERTDLEASGAGLEVIDLLRGASA